MAKLAEKLRRLPVRRIYQTKKVLPLGPWRPDLPPFGNPGLITCQNVIPHYQNYKPFPGPNVVTNALDARCQGAASFVGDDFATHLYAGDATKLYRYVDGTMTDSSKSGGYSTASDEWWEFTRFANKVIATNYADAVQSVTFGGTTFADQFTSTLKPQCRHLDTVRNRFLFIGNTIEGGTDFPRRVRWSAIDNAADMDASTSTLAGSTDLGGRGGAVQKVVGGRDYGVIFQENAITRVEFVGLPEIWIFDEIEVNKGAYTPQAVVPLGRFVFYLDEEGFFVFDGTQSIPIGDGKIDRDFFGQVDTAQLFKMHGSIFFDHSLVVWPYQSNAATNGIPDLLLMYHWPTGEWAEVDLDMEVVLNTVSFGYTMEGLDSISTDLDDTSAFAFSLDSKVWAGGNPLFGGFNEDHKLVYFNGAALSAILETGERQVHATQKSTIKSIRPVGDGIDSGATVEIGTRNTHSETASFNSTVTANSNGEHTFRGQQNRARYHRFRFKGTFTELQGLEIEGQATGGLQ